MTGQFQKLVFTGTLVLSPVVFGQSIECGADDYRCLQNAYELACTRRGDATVASCARWISQIEEHEFAQESDWRLIAASAYTALARLTNDPRRSEEYLNSARNINRDVLAQDPGNTEALIGLSALSEPGSSERLEYMRAAVESDPTNVMALQSLASKEAARGNLSGAAELYMRAYESDTGRSRWHHAAAALGLYERAGATARYDELRDKVVQQIELQSYLNRLRANVAQAAAHLSTICYDPIITIIGTNPCVIGIEAVVDAVVQMADSEVAYSLAEEAASAMVSAANSQRFVAEVRAFRASFETTINTILDAGIRSGMLYDTYASFAETAQERISALESAVSEAPQNGQYRYRLGLAYLEGGMPEEAITAFLIARSSLEPWQQDIADRQIERAELLLQEND